MTPTYTLDQIQATLDSYLDIFEDDPVTREIITNLGRHLIAELKKLPPHVFVASGPYVDLPETPISESAMVRATLLSALTALRINGNAETSRAFLHNLQINLTPILQRL